MLVNCSQWKRKLSKRSKVAIASASMAGMSLSKEKLDRLKKGQELATEKSNAFNQTLQEEACLLGNSTRDDIEQYRSNMIGNSLSSTSIKNVKKKTNLKKSATLLTTRTLESHPHDDFQDMAPNIKGGTYGDVDVITKTINFSNSKSCRNQLKETNILGCLDHENIIKSFGSMCVDDDQCFMVAEKYGRDALVAFTLKGSITEEDSKMFSTGLFSALDYLHQNGIVHRDIKPENVLVDENWVPKLTDFEYASSIVRPQDVNAGLYPGKKPGNLKHFVDRNRAGTAMYLSPDAWNTYSNEHFDQDHQCPDIDWRKAEIWSAGNTVHYVSNPDTYLSKSCVEDYAGARFGSSDEEFIKKVQEFYSDLSRAVKRGNKGKALKIYKAFVKKHSSFLPSDSLKRLFEQCVQFHPDQRPNAREAIDILGTQLIPGIEPDVTGQRVRTLEEVDILEAEKRPRESMSCDIL